MSEDFQFGRERKQPSKVRRHPLNFIFDPLYPFIIAAAAVAAAAWYFNIPVRHLLDLDGFNPAGLAGWLR